MSAYRTAPAKTWQSQVITSNTSWAVPAGVSVVFADYAGAGGGGGGGHATGGGGGGGAAGITLVDQPIAVTPGATLTVTIGAAGTAGSIAGAGGQGGDTTITGALINLPTAYGGDEGKAGQATNGGDGGVYGSPQGPIYHDTNTTGDADGGAGFTLAASVPGGRYVGGMPGTPGAGSSGGGGGSSRQFIGTGNISGGTSSGGGSGGSCVFGDGGAGGNQAAAGAAPAAGHYGAGGGGGGRNAAGAAGAAGVVVLRWMA